MLHHADAATALCKTSIFALYRRCLRSVQTIPDPSKRATYLIYVRDGFYRAHNLPSNSREALLAYRDGLEQVEQMEYYHSQMRKKQNEKQPRMTPRLPTQKIIDTGKNESDNSILSITANKDIEQWLLLHLPHLNKEDVATYSRHLVHDGFDSVPFIEEELLAEDISFMKKAHRRVIERQLRSRRDGDTTKE